MLPRWYALAAVFAAAALCACVHAPIDAVSPSIETLKLLRQPGIAPVALGRFADADGVRIGKSINIRGSTLNAPSGGSFADFLKSTLQAELEAAGKMDAASPTILNAALTESRASENMASGNTSLGAELSLVRGGATIFSKRYRVESQWKSEFIGALAIPEAFRQYNALYALLVRQAFSDPEMIAALRR